MLVVRMAGAVTCCVALKSVVIHLDVAEELVVLLLAVGQVECTEHHSSICGLGFEALAIQVVIVGDLERELDGRPIECLGFDLERLIDRQQVILVGRVDAGGSERDDKGKAVAQ